MDFDEVMLLPSTMKSVEVITRFTNELARQSVVALDAALRDRLVQDVAKKLDPVPRLTEDGITIRWECSLVRNSDGRCRR